MSKSKKEELFFLSHLEQGGLRKKGAYKKIYTVFIYYLLWLYLLYAVKGTKVAIIDLKI